MIDKALFNADPTGFPANTKFKHKEHIIQNALGGRLKSDKILCEECGNILNEQVDKDFKKLFSSFTEKLKDQLAKERNSKSNSPVKGMHTGTKKPVIFQDWKTYPAKPDYSISEKENIIIIYARKEAMPGYKNFILEKLKSEGTAIENYAITEVTEYDSHENIGLFFSEGVEDFNEKWRMGFIKIASEFAYLNGVERNQLTRTLDVKENKLIFTHNVIPYFPIGIFEFVFEMHRNVLENDYPTHTLILFTQQHGKEVKILYCYIDLFSTFQFYVILNDKFVGDDICEIYSQKAEKEIKEEIDFRAVRQKYVRLVAEEAGIDLTKYKGGNIEEFYNFLEKEYAKITPDYTANLPQTIYGALTRIQRGLMLKKVKKTNPEKYAELPDYLSGHVMDNLTEKMESDLIFEMRSYLNDDELVNTNRFKQVFLELDANRNIEQFSTVQEIMQGYNEYNDALKSYGHTKFEQFSIYSNSKIKIG